VTVCEKVVPRLNKHDDVIEWNFMKIASPKWRAGCAPAHRNDILMDKPTVVHGTYLSVPFPSHSNLCLSHPMGRFPRDSHRNDIPMDKLGYPDNCHLGKLPPRYILTLFYVFFCSAMKLNTSLQTDLKWIWSAFENGWCFRCSPQTSFYSTTPLCHPDNCHLG